MKKCIQFGKLIREEREKRQIPLWRFASSVPFPQSNIQRIESGKTEPRIGLAVRMVHALGADVGEFMTRLMEVQDFGASPNQVDEGNDPQRDMSVLSSENSLVISGAPAEVFGLLIKEARMARGLTQAKLAEYADCTTRSLIEIEGGRQEPSLTTALRLVWAIGYDAAVFFKAYSKILCKISE